MAVNLPPQYHDAEAEYKKGRNAEEKLAALRKMWVILPKHKASEKVQAALKTKMADLSDEIEAIKSGPKKAPPGSFKIPKQGAGTIVLVGGPNGGRSSLMRALTKATPEVAAYPFTTREPVPGMMEWEDVRIQLIELPPISADMYEPCVTDFCRTADSAALVVDLGDDDGPFAAESAWDRLTQRNLRLVPTVPEGVEDPSVFHIASFIIAAKIDADGAADRLEIFREMVADRLPIITVSAVTGEGLPDLRSRFFKSLEVMRIYGKQPGKPADRSSPFTIPIGGTVLDFAEKVHTDLVNTLKAAKVWGSAQYDGMTVKKDHVLREGDVVELVM